MTTMVPSRSGESHDVFGVRYIVFVVLGRPLGSVRFGSVRVRSGQVGSDRIGSFFIALGSDWFLMPLYVPMPWGNAVMVNRT